jgi:hypothetical protein
MDQVTNYGGGSMNCVTTRQLWSPEERASIANILSDGILLSDITTLVPTRTELAVIREVYKTNRYSIRTMNDGTKRFFTEIKTRNRKRKEESVVVKSVEASTTTDTEVYENKQVCIVPQKLKNTSKELKAMALVLLYENGLLATSESVRHTIKLLSQYQKEIK